MIKHIHFVGIKGVGMAPLAIIAKEAGITVSGSDIADTFITDTVLKKHDIIPFVDFDSSHIKGADMVITTGAHGGFDNPETVAAKENHISVLTQGQAVGEFMENKLLGQEYSGISIAGTHGKTTTTAMVAVIFSQAKLDPSWIIGTSEVPSLGDGGHFGRGKYFIAEADEYANEPQYDKTPKMLLQHPKIAVITNVEHDHPDVYPTLEDSYRAFLQFAQLVPKDGVLITCGDDKGAREVIKNYSGNLLTYGFSEKNDFQVKNVIKTHSGIEWDVVSKNSTIHLSLSVPGEHNAFNATAAYIVSLRCGINEKEIQKGLLAFTGTKRRMEYIGQLKSGALLYDDYAHHPTEIEKTLTAIREKYPQSHIVCIFQPHTYSRTKLLFDQFLDSLSLADEIVLSDIYSSKREAPDPTVSSAMMVDKLKLNKPVVLAKTLLDVVQYITQKSYGNDTIILSMGAGDIYQIANSLLS